MNNNIESASESIIEATIISLYTSQEMLLEILRPIFERNYEIAKNQNNDKRVYPKNSIKKSPNISNLFFS